MRIIMLNSELKPGSGVSEVARIIGNGLLKRGHELLMLTTSVSIPSSCYDFEVQEINFPLIKEEIPAADAIYCHYGKLEPVALYLKIKKKLPLIIHDHGTAFPWLYSHSYFARYSLEFLMRYSSLRAADRVITISRFLQRVNWIVYGRKSKVIYNGIDSNRFKFNQQSRTRTRKRLGIESRILILFVGRLSPHKRIVKLVKTIQETRRKQPSIALAIIGTPFSEGYRDQIERIASRDDTVVFMGAVSQENLPSYYSAADIYATCSGWEGFDLPVLEAMSSGLPTVVFDVGAHREIVSKSSGVLIENSNYSAFKGKILELADNTALRKDLSTRCREHSLHYSWDRTVSKVERVLHDTVKKTG